MKFCIIFYLLIRFMWSYFRLSFLLMQCNFYDSYRKLISLLFREGRRGHCSLGRGRETFSSRLFWSQLTTFDCLSIFLWSSVMEKTLIKLGWTRKALNILTMSSSRRSFYYLLLMATMNISDIFLRHTGSCWLLLSFFSSS